VDPTWNPYPQNSRYPEPFPNLAGLVANGTDLFVIGDFDSIGGQTRHGLALLAGADAPRLVEGPYSIVFVRRNPLDAAEVSHYRITDIKGGNLCLAGSLARVRVGDFITVEDGANGLHFIRDGSSGSISAVSALNETPDGAGNAETTLVVQGEPASCILHFGLNDGLTLAGLQGRSYRIEYTEALGDGANWLPLTTATSAGVPQVVPGTRSTAQRQCYYRAVLIP
jgi:hypothetical protein